MCDIEVALSIYIIQHLWFIDGEGQTFNTKFAYDK
jgi:hypothetical protein